MGLLQNGYRHRLVGRIYGATLLDGAVASALFYNSNQAASNRNTLSGYDIATAAAPGGALHPVAWIMPRKPGGLSARMTDGGSGLSASALAVKLAYADLAGSGDLEAFGGLVVNLLADLVGSGGISAADLKAFLQMAADLSGQGDVAATVGGLAALIASLEGEGTAATSLLTAIGALAADILSYGELTPEGIRDSVWRALASQYGEAGTMGALLNAAGSGGMDPALIAKIVDIWQRLGLDPANPMTTTATQIAAGDVTIDMVEAPAGTVTSTRQP